MLCLRSSQICFGATRACARSGAATHCSPNGAYAVMGTLAGEPQLGPGALPAPSRGTDAKIDALVYELYGLTEEEIAIVEGRDH